MPIRMPGQDKLPNGPHRQLLEAVHELYNSAGYPGIRKISSAIRVNNDLHDTISHEGISKILGGETLPRQWLKLDALVRQLLACHTEPVDAPGEVARIRGLWVAAIGMSAPHPSNIQQHSEGAKIVDSTHKSGEVQKLTPDSSNHLKIDTVTITIRPPERRNFFAAEIRQHHNPDQGQNLHNEFLGLINSAAEGSGINSRDWHMRSTGDGVIGVIPPDTPERYLVDHFTRALAAGLRRRNIRHTPARRMGIGLAIGFGIIRFADNGFTGSRLINTIRLLDHTEMRRSRQGLTLALADRVYEDSITENLTSFPRGAFQRIAVDAKGMSIPGWLLTDDEI
ncbi:hypothetical protein [Kitasatospora sp. NPDC088779]|uniref:hypothetical protein n=1 Tax=Kitasatospora sp. NPDC088779 TaxID=3154964 RepID=UPI00341435E4